MYHPAKMQYSFRTLLIATTLISLIVVCVSWYFRVIHYGIDDGYAQWGAAEMVMAYMDDHDGEWPPNWESLRPQFDAGRSGVGGWSFEKYKSRIWIDFDADPVDLRRQSLKSNKPTFNVIRATHSTGVYVGDDPNSMLWSYFRSDVKH